jgi:hypothetical protein
LSFKKFEANRNLERRRRRAQRIWLFVALGDVFLAGAGFLLSRGNQNLQTLTAIAVRGAPSLKVDKEKPIVGGFKLDLCENIPEIAISHRSCTLISSIKWNIPGGKKSFRGIESSWLGFIQS